MEQEIHKLNKLVSLMPYLTDINKTECVNVGSNLPYTSLGEVNILTLIREYFVKLTRKILNENLIGNDLNAADSCIRKEDRSYLNIQLAKLELKRLEKQIEKRKKELFKIHGQIKSARMDHISLLRRITLYQQELNLMAQDKDDIEINHR